MLLAVGELMSATESEGKCRQRWKRTKMCAHVCALKHIPPTKKVENIKMR